MVEKDDDSVEGDMRVFTKEAPCSKIDIYNCFYGAGSFYNDDDLRSCDIVRARSIIGRNVPRRLVEQGHAVLVQLRGQEHIKLTEEGNNWLIKGVNRYLKNNPDKFSLVENPPARWRRRFADVCT